MTRSTLYLFLSFLVVGMGGVYAQIGQGGRWGIVETLSQASGDARYLQLSGGALTGAVTTTSTIASGGTGPLQLGAAWTPIYLGATANATTVKSLESETGLYAPYVYSGQVTVPNGSTPYGGFTNAPDAITFFSRGTGYASNNIRIEAIANRSTTRAWADSTSAVRVGVCSPLAIATNSTRCGYFEHRGTASDGSSFFIGSLSGPVAIKSVGFNLPEVTGDPCGGANFDIGSLFFNLTSGYPCMCNASRADVKLTDNTTACF